MSKITWNTPAGSLGTLKELDYFEYPLSATSDEALSIEYTHISGNLPSGMRVSADGIVKGVPVVTSETNSRTVVYAFTVRANTPTGVIADRTFNITVNNFSLLRIDPRAGFESTFDDGSFLNMPFTAISENPNAKLTWSIISGEIPVDIRTNEPMTLSQDGVFSGYISRLIDTTGPQSGYDVEPDDEFPYDFSPTSRDKTYVFNVQVTDGSSFDVVPVTIRVVSKGHFTADNEITLVNNSELPVDADNTYPPIITTDPSTIPTLTAGDRFAFKFDGFDPQGNIILWSANSSLPNGLTLSSVTGWLTGTMPTQTESEKDYVFSVQAYKQDYTNIRSLELPVTIHTVKNNTDTITWVTGTKAGTITNGTVSELSISAVNNAGKELTYTMVNGAQEKLPQGLKLISNGDIIGRCTFEYFSLDSSSANITVASTLNITVGMTLEGPGVASGCQVQAVIDGNTVKIAPATYVTAGAEITFTDGFVNVVTQLTDLSTTTMIDGGRTTFDSTYTFTVKAETIDNTVSSTKTFTVAVDNYNRAPYENLYLKALPSLDQRTIFNSVISNTDIFPDELLYRAQDPWFGKATDIKTLFLAGMTASSLSAFANSTQYNHYNKPINFGDIKTARAVDANFNTKYEVVYVDLADTNSGVLLTQEPAITNYYLYGDQSYHTLYPNSFENMTYRMSSGIGFANRGALPDWMTSPQEDGKVLGLVRGVVLAYTVPGASKLIAYRLKNNGITFNNIQFVADRYQIDAGITDIYDVGTNMFKNTEYVRTLVTHDDQWASVTGTHIEAIPGPQTQETTFDVESGFPTTFDTDTTNFFISRYKYSEPEIGDKYIKFPQIGVYK